jgi:hypothetical protein
VEVLERAGDEKSFVGEEEFMARDSGVILEGQGRGEV